MIWLFGDILVVSLSRTIFGLCIYIEWLRKAFCSLELRIQFCLLVCCTYPSLSTVNKEKNLTDQRASLRVDRRETQQIETSRYSVTPAFTGRHYVGLAVVSLCTGRERLTLCFPFSGATSSVANQWWGLKKRGDKQAAARRYTLCITQPFGGQIWLICGLPNFARNGVFLFCFFLCLFVCLFGVFSFCFVFGFGGFFFWFFLFWFGFFCGPQGVARNGLFVAYQILQSMVYPWPISCREEWFVSVLHRQNNNTMFIGRTMNDFRTIFNVIKWNRLFAN